MSSLTGTAIASRKVIRYGIYLLILLLIARTVFNFGKSVYLKIFPPKPPGENLALGDKLPRLPFPEKTFPDGISFKIETADGKMPTFPNVMPVYEMPAIPQSLTALEDAKTKASQLDFDANSGRPILETTPSIYIFDKKNTPSNLTMNIITGIFSISYDIAQDRRILNNIPASDQVAKDQIRAYLGNAGSLTPDLSKGTMTFEYIKGEIDDNGVVQFNHADSLSEANLVKVNLFRKNFGPKDEYVNVTPKYPDANIWFIMSTNTNQIVRGEYHSYPINPDKNGTYAVKSAEQALDELKNKKGFIANMGTNTPGEITIRKIYLAYYDPGQYAQFYQPVVVFEGDNGFFAYVPAVIDEHYGADPQKQ